MNIYLAAPFGTPNSKRRRNACKVRDYLRGCGFNVYAPWEMFIPNAWDLPNAEWGRKVFEADKNAIDGCDWVVLLCYGRKRTTSGTNWEAGYAYGIGKKVLVVEMDFSDQMSLMVSNGSWAVVKGIDGLGNYDFDKAEKQITDTEQKQEKYNDT